MFIFNVIISILYITKYFILMILILLMKISLLKLKFNIVLNFLLLIDLLYLLFFLLDMYTKIIHIFWSKTTLKITKII